MNQGIYKYESNKAVNFGAPRGARTVAATQRLPVTAALELEKTMDWINQHFHEKDGFPRPDWENIHKEAEDNHSAQDQHALWNDIAKTWLEKTISRLNNDYSIYESENFFLVTSESSKYVSLFQAFLERTRTRILNTLNKIASDEGYGKHVVLIFNDIDTYYSYTSYFYENDGAYGLSAGVYVNRGYGHFVFPHQEISYAESIAAHEMTHALLTHLEIPAWLNEGMAVSIENMITGSAPLKMDNETFSRHHTFWGENEIQDFWSGKAFSRTGEGQELSYQLAQFAVNSLAHDPEAFIEFSNKAHYSDGGESAAQEVFEGSLGELIAQYFGEGNWAPNSELWESKNSNKAFKSVARQSAPLRTASCCAAACPLCGVRLVKNEHGFR